MKADRIYTFQQTLAIQFIEGLAFILTDPDRSRRVTVEQFRALCRMVERDPSVSPSLKPSVYFDRKFMVLPDRILVEDLTTWLLDLHEHYSAMGQRRATR